MSIVHLGSESDYNTIVIATTGHSILFFFGKLSENVSRIKHSLKLSTVTLKGLSMVHKWKLAKFVSSLYAYLVLGDKLEYLSGDKKMTKQSKYIRLHAVSLSQPEPSLSLSGSEEATYSGPKIPTFIIPFPISETHILPYLYLFGITNNWKSDLIFL